MTTPNILLLVQIRAFTEPIVWIIRSYLLNIKRVKVEVGNVDCDSKEASLLC